MRRIQILGVTMVIICLGCTSNAGAGSVMYTDQAAWQNEVLNSGYDVTNIGFENTVSPDFYTVTAGDVVFSSYDLPLIVDDFYGIPYNSGKVLYPFFNQAIQVALPGSVYAFGFDLGEIFLGPDFIDVVPTLGNVALSTGEIFAGPYEGNTFPTFAFFGFCSDIPITFFSMHPHALVEPIIDNFRYAQAAVPTPEPSSLLLLGSGLFGLASYLRRNRRR
ncbi:MAG: hypothetical protein VR65_03050 [Desulfobulbaceae bacterium BRH_c16a]|nr:MAG: hypothetical protein VR65_03050 [Desulfobulbaceae bacterium BRH_c16a]